MQHVEQAWHRQIGALDEQAGLGVGLHLLAQDGIGAEADRHAQRDQGQMAKRRRLDGHADGGKADGDSSLATNPFTEQ